MVFSVFRMLDVRNCVLLVRLLCLSNIVQCWSETPEQEVMQHVRTDSMVHLNSVHQLLWVIESSEEEKKLMVCYVCCIQLVIGNGDSLHFQSCCSSLWLTVMFSSGLGMEGVRGAHWWCQLIMIGDLLISLGGVGRHLSVIYLSIGNQASTVVMPSIYMYIRMESSCV